MNVLLFDDCDLLPNGQLAIHDRRAEHLLDVLHVKPGTEVRVGKINGGLGEALVREVRGRMLFLELQELKVVVPNELQVHLVLAMPRPQSLKKILQSAATLGVASIQLIAAERVERSYFSSPLLRAENIRAQLLLGLEQGVATRMPQIEILPRFRPERLSAADSLVFDAYSQKARSRLLAHPTVTRSLLQTYRSAGAAGELFDDSGSLLLAIGPEGGWLPAEVRAFEDRGFRSFHLGHRVLRVETAVDVAVAQLQLLHELSLRKS
jgi:RsmE family RNA methyltransferase